MKICKDCTGPLDYPDRTRCDDCDDDVTFIIWVEIERHDAREEEYNTIEGNTIARTKTLEEALSFL